MAVEAKRGCGFRRVGGLYLVGGGMIAPCDRLPVEIGHCPVCHTGLHFSRGLTQINPLKLWGVHPDCKDDPLYSLSCPMCNPKENPAFLLGVGAKFYPTPQDFIAEGGIMGISKRIAQLPKNFKLGETYIYLVHPKAFSKLVPVKAKDQANETQGKMMGELEYSPGVFYVFRPQRIEKLIWKSEASDEELKKLEKRGITPVIIPDGDQDHKPKKKE